MNAKQESAESTAAFLMRIRKAKEYMSTLKEADLLLKTTMAMKTTVRKMSRRSRSLRLEEQCSKFSRRLYEVAL